MTRLAKQWFSLEVEFDRNVEEIISSMLWELGTLGIVTSSETAETITLLGYFDRPVEPATIRPQLIEALADSGHTAGQLHGVNVAEVPDEDWLKKWKEGYQPFTVGERFLITPSWARPELDLSADRVVIEIDPGMAFGTGTHETTRLCLAAIEKYWHGGSLLDVGTGTGILAIGAIKLYPDATVVACDNDAEAIIVARENLEINRVEQLIKISVGSAADYRGGNFDLVVANLTADVIVPLLPELIACLARQRKLVLSGILDSQQAQVCAALTEHQQKIIEICPAGEWVAIISE